MTDRPRPVLMDQKIKQEWVAQLVSGDYLQGHAFLNAVGEDGCRRYCCLGVLSDMAVKAGVIEAVELPNGRGSFVTYQPRGGGDSGKGSSIALIPAVLLWAAIPASRGGGGDITLGVSSAIRMNDRDKLPFKAIAAAIQRFL